LIEVVGEALLGGLLRFPATEAHLQFSLRWSPGGMNQRRGGGLADVGENSGDGLRLGEERDEGEGGATGGAGQREGLVDSGQKSGPRGGSAAACGGWLGLRRGSGGDESGAGEGWRRDGPGTPGPRGGARCVRRDRAPGGGRYGWHQDSEANDSQAFLAYSEFRQRCGLGPASLRWQITRTDSERVGRNLAHRFWASGEALFHRGSGVP
jgi:hypothetical protein